MSSAKEKYLEDQSYRIDKQDTDKKKKKMEESIRQQFQRRVEEGKLIIDGDTYKKRPLTEEEQKDVDEINKMMEEKFANKKDGGLMKKAKGGMANKKKPAKKSKLAGRLTMRGYGAVIR